jgi:hypothetical protein
MANSHNKLRKIVRITSKHTSFYHATIPKVKQIQLQKWSTNEKIEKKMMLRIFKHVYFSKVEPKS